MGTVHKRHLRLSFGPARSLGALRFEFRGATLAVLGLALAIGIHAQSSDPTGFGWGCNPAASMQALIIVSASTGLIVAAIIRQHVRRCWMGRANAELEARVTERTRDIEAAERRFKATFQNAGVGISIVGGDGTLIRVNERLARMLGYTADEMEGHPLDEFTHPDDLALGAAAWDRLMAGATDEYELEKRYRHKDGTSVWATPPSAASAIPTAGSPISSRSFKTLLREGALMRRARCSLERSTTAARTFSRSSR